VRLECSYGRVESLGLELQEIKRVHPILYVLFEVDG
jgi:hypothetical protein